MKNLKRFFPFIRVIFFSASINCVLAQTAPTLGSAQSFAVLGSSTVTNTGSTILNGDLGVSPGAAITGFPPGVVNGTVHNADAVAAQARNDANGAYNSLAVQPCNTILSGQDLGGLTLTPGVYCFASSAQLTGTLTLNAEGNPNALFIFKIGSTLTTAANASVTLVNGATACNVYFQVGSSATLGTGTQFAGSILALASVGLNSNASITGRAIGLNGAVTLDTNMVSVPTCSGVMSSGFVQVCKVAGVGIAVGTNVSFTVAGTAITVAAGAAPGGSCSAPIQVPTGSVFITEAVPAGVTLTGVSTSPAASALISSNLGAGTASVAVTAGTQTTVTFINAATPPPPNGFVQVCKVAGAGVAVGTNFTFNVAGTPVTISAGSGPGGTCGTPVSVPAGTASIMETLPAGIALAGVSTQPSAGLLVGSNLGAGSATVTVLSGSQTIVTFIDVAIPAVPTNGYVQVCKVAGSGVAAGTNFTFNVGGIPVTVPAGSAPGGNCAPAVTQPAGTTVVTETIPAGIVVAGVGTSPNPALLVSSNLAAGTATVTVNAGGQTIVTFIDAAAPVLPNTGFVQVCKVAGAGVTVGANVGFNVAGTSVTVAAGAAPGGTCAAPVTVPAGTAVITETIPGGTAVTGISTLPSAGLLVSSNLAGGTANVTVNAGGQTIVTFIDAAVAGIPTTGFVQVCKVAGAGIAAGTNFTFNVGGTPVTVGAGAAPGGTCATPIALPVGSAVITETIPAGTVVAGVSTLPSAGLLVSSNLAGGTANVTVLPGGQTIVTFIDALAPVVPGTGFLQVCKVAGAGIPAGTNFIFNVAGTMVTVAAGSAPGGTCAAPVTVAAGPAVITEMAATGVSVAGISTLPSSALLVSSDLGARTATVTVNAAGQTIVTFIDIAAIVPAIDYFQVNYVSNLNIGDSFIDVTNTGAGGNLCVNAYAFSPDEQLISCCSCLVTPNGLSVFSARGDLISNTLTPAVPTSVVVKLIATTGDMCNAATVGTAGNVLASGLAAWRTTLHALPVTPGTPATTYGATETRFTSSTLSAAELARITTLCALTQANGSGFGICRACRLGGLGAVRQ